MMIIFDKILGRIREDNPSSSSGSGTVTLFSAGNLANFFTTSVNTPSTTPALSFTLNTQTPYNFPQANSAGTAIQWVNLLGNNVISVTAASTTALPAFTYNNGASGVGATITINAVGALPNQDGVTLTLNETLLYKDDSNAIYNGVYTYTTVGNGGTQAVLTRSTNADTPTELTNEVVIPTNGTVNKNVVFSQQTDEPVIGTDDIVYDNTPVPAPTGKGWLLNLNNTNAVYNKFGTKSNQDVRLYTNAVQRGAFFKTGEFGWGITSSPSAKVHIQGATADSSTYALKLFNATPASLFQMRNDGSWGLGLTAGLGTDFTCVNIGFNPTSSGSASIAIGSLPNAGVRGIAVGDQSHAYDYGIAIGYIASAGSTGVGAIAIGQSGTTATNIDNIAIGTLAQATGLGSIMIGGSNIGAVTNDVYGSLRVALSWRAGTRIAKQSFFLYNTSNLLLFNSGVFSQSDLEPNWTAPFDYVAENTVTLHNGSLAAPVTVIGVTDHGGDAGAWFQHGASTFDQWMSGTKVELSGSSVYANGIYYAHWEDATHISFHATRIDALAKTGFVTFISDEAGATITFFPVSPDNTGQIADTVQLFSIVSDDGDATLGLQMNQQTVNETITPNYTIKVIINQGNTTDGIYKIPLLKVS